MKGPGAENTPQKCVWSHEMRISHADLCAGKILFPKVKLSEEVARQGEIPKADLPTQIEGRRCADKAHWRCSWAHCDIPFASRSKD